MKEKNSVIIVGDLFPVPSNFSLFSDGDVQSLFGEKIYRLFSDADYRICNLEGALTDGNTICEKTGPLIKAPTKVVKAYSKLGINCCMLANNHITDAGHQGVLDTIRTLDEAGISHIGAGKDEFSICHFITFPVANYIIGLYNVCETMYNKPTGNLAGAYLYDEYQVCHELESFKKKCDYLIVVYHGGAEQFRYPSPETRKRFYRMADSGADMILSQHTHCVGSEEYYNGTYLLYGQGNFLFRSFDNEFTDTGLIIELEISESNYVVNKHLVNAIGDKVRYADTQDFKSFNERSAHVKDEDFVLSLYKEYCRERLPSYLTAFKSRFWGRKFLRILKRFSPKSYNYLLSTKGYDRKDLLLTLHTLRSEQNREIALFGIESLLKEMICKNE